MIVGCTEIKQPVQLQGEPKSSPKSITYRYLTVPLFHEPFTVIITGTQGLYKPNKCLLKWGFCIKKNITDIQVESFQVVSAAKRDSFTYPHLQCAAGVA